MKKVLILLCATSLLQPLFAQQATVTEAVETVKTYPLILIRWLIPPICFILISVLMVFLLKEPTGNGK